MPRMRAKENPPEPPPPGADAEKAGRRFHDAFRRQHEQFLAHVTGPRSRDERSRRAARLLRRLMFLFFLQKNGLLDGDADYLHRRLGGRSFYRRVLRPLFRAYQLEAAPADLDVADAAFPPAFDFLDGYRWRLDERPPGGARDVTPAVLGDLFERSLDQKPMGAYYTGDDVSRYICRGTIVPFLLDAVRRECPDAFTADGAWQLLRRDPDRYIPEAVKHGAAAPLPPGIASGLNDATRRAGWDRAAPPAYALPTETWREHLARRRRYQEGRARLAAGAVTAVDDLVSDNLDFARFAGDVLAQGGSPHLLRAFWKALRSLSVLDPTCGAGAFLLSALDTLEPLYVACLDGMRRLLDHRRDAPGRNGRDDVSDFRAVLNEAAGQPTRRSFVLRSIVLGNLYGVDLMEEAVEVCRMRLLLRLLAAVGTAGACTPLPDLGRNIRCGNALAGGVTASQCLPSPPSTGARGEEARPVISASRGRSTGTPRSPG
jgi:hypothetical protein